MTEEEDIERVIHKYLEDTFNNKDAIPNVMVEGLAKAIVAHYRYMMESW